MTRFLVPTLKVIVLTRIFSSQPVHDFLTVRSPVLLFTEITFMLMFELYHVPFSVRATLSKG